jgi:hypothetical protein
VFCPLRSSGNYFRIDLKGNNNRMVRVKVKVKFTLEHATKVHKGSISKALLLLYLRC